MSAGKITTSPSITKGLSGFTCGGNRFHQPAGGGPVVVVPAPYHRLMIRTLSSPTGKITFPHFYSLLFGLLLLAGLLYYQHHRSYAAAELFAVATSSTGMAFTYEVTTSDVAADWSL